MRTGCRDGLAWLLLSALAFGSGEIAHSQTPMVSLTGIVRDAAGVGIPDVEVTLRSTAFAARTNAKGEFSLANIPSATYHVFFRRLGYASVDYTWAPAAGEKTEVAVVLERLAQALDPVKVRADEDRRFAVNSSISGMVSDTAGRVLAEAEVRIMGANMAGMTRANGGFLFKPMALGPHVIRVRKLGYAPVTMTVDLQRDEDRELYIRMTPLAQSLDAMVINEESGFGNQIVWDELEQRRRVHDPAAYVFGKDYFARYGSLPLDWAMKTMNVYSPKGGKLAASGGTASYGFAGDLCILINGRIPMLQPFAWKTDELDMLEVYPNGTEYTGTVANYFQNSPVCKWRRSLTDHPTYYVVWLKGTRPQ